MFHYYSRFFFFFFHLTVRQYSKKAGNLIGIASTILYVTNKSASKKNHRKCDLHEQFLWMQKCRENVGGNQQEFIPFLRLAIQISFEHVWWNSFDSTLFRCAMHDCI